MAAALPRQVGCSAGVAANADPQWTGAGATAAVATPQGPPPPTATRQLPRPPIVGVPSAPGATETQQEIILDVVQRLLVVNQNGPQNSRSTIGIAYEDTLRFFAGEGADWQVPNKRENT